MVFTDVVLSVIWADETFQVEAKQPISATAVPKLIMARIKPMCQLTVRYWTKTSQTDKSGVEGLVG